MGRRDQCLAGRSLGAGGECLLVDAPPEPGSIVDRLSADGPRLVALVSTHGHVDHVGGIASVVRAQDHEVPFHIHDADRHMLLDPVGTSGALGQVLASQGLDVRPPELIHGLDHGDRVSGAGLTLTAIHTPGHTKGSTCLLLEADGEAPVLFSGDHLFKGPIGRTDLPGGSGRSCWPPWRRGSCRCRTTFGCCPATGQPPLSATSAASTPSFAS